jgi:hypothetical protein
VDVLWQVAMPVEEKPGQKVVYHSDRTVVYKNDNWHLHNNKKKNKYQPPPPPHQRPFRPPPRYRQPPPQRLPFSDRRSDWMEASQPEAYFHRHWEKER